MKRYDFCVYCDMCEVEEHSLGDWVAFEDVEKLKKILDDLIHACEYDGCENEMDCDDMNNLMQKVFVARDRAKKALGEIDD